MLSLGGGAGGDGGSSSIAGADYAADDDCVVDGRRCLPWCVHGFIIIYHYFVFVFISGGFFVESLKIHRYTQYLLACNYRYVPTIPNEQ